MKKILITLAAIAVYAQVVPALADTTIYRNAAAQQSAYMVSVVLRSSDNGIVIKLAHGLNAGASKDEAIGAFVRKTLAQFPGYSVIDSIASPVPQSGEKCGPSI